MAEYVYGFVPFEEIPEYKMVRREEVVRCRDCKHFNDYHFKCHRPAFIIDAHGNLYFQGEGLMSATDANPDGFCAWGERKEDA